MLKGGLSKYYDEKEYNLDNYTEQKNLSLQSEKPFLTNMADYDPLSYYEGKDHEKLIKYEQDKLNYLKLLQNTDFQEVEYKKSLKKTLNSIADEQKANGSPFVFNPNISFDKSDKSETVKGGKKKSRNSKTSKKSKSSKTLKKSKTSKKSRTANKN